MSADALKKAGITLVVVLVAFFIWEKWLKTKIAA
jgi:hypothetical protein